MKNFMPTTDLSNTLTGQRSATVNLAAELIARASVTPLDVGCQGLMRERLEALGFSCQTLIFGEGSEAVENLWSIRNGAGNKSTANKSAANAPIFCFAGHTDVVPTGRESDWKTPPFIPTIKDSMLYGRGAADMKGSLAAMITACEDFIQKYPNHDGQIAFLITADEEGPAKNGTVKVVEWLKQNNIHLEWCLVGEPSSTNLVGDTIKNGRRGSLGAKLIVKGKQGHVAYPHLGDNPIHKIAPVLAELSTQQWDNGNDFFPATSFQISNINGGTGATNVIPGEVEIIFNFRFSTELTAEILQERTEAILLRHGLVKGVNYDLEWNLSGQPFLTAKGKLVSASVDAIKEITGRDTVLSTAGGTSDGRFIAPTGSQVLELGPCNATIHQIDESVNIDDLDCLSKIYSKILKNLLLSAS
jgi:succinyl-diaminopimelate desuccinylase